MQQLINEYNERKKEIECYYKFLREITSKVYVFKNVRNSLDKRIDDKIVKILKANTFILLYNLIESTVNNSVLYVCKKISDENIKYDKIVDGLKKQWIKVHVNKHLQSPNDNKLQGGVKYIIDKTLNESIQFENDYSIKFPTNIDAEILRRLASNFEFKLKFPNSLKGGYKIKEIKDKRNGLAHGNISFLNCGQDTTMEDLTSYKNDTYRILEKFIKSIKTYTCKKKYLKN